MSTEGRFILNLPFSYGKKVIYYKEMKTGVILLGYFSGGLPDWFLWLSVCVLVGFIIFSQWWTNR